MNIGQRIADLRKAKGFKSQNALAAASGVSQGLISEIESGKVSASRFDTLQKLAEALGVSMPELTGPDQSESDSLGWFWKTRFALLRVSEIEAMKESTAARVGWAVKQMLDGLSPGEAGRRLKHPDEYLTAVVANKAEATGDLMDALVELADLPPDWIRIGDTGPIDTQLKKLLQSPYAGAYLTFLVRAIEHRMLPELLESQLDVLLRARE